MIEEKVMELIQQQTQKIADFLQQNEVSNDYGSEALKWLEDYIDRRRTTMSPDERTTLHVLIGAFWGECLRRAHGGEWIGIGEEGHKQLGLRIDVTLTVMPFAQVGKYVADPKFNSFSSLFRSTKTILSYLREKQAGTSDNKSLDRTVTIYTRLLTNENYVAAINRDVKVVENLLRDSSIANDYGVSALSWLENMMEENRHGAVAQNSRWFLEGVGAFLGECLCRTYDGIWVENEHGLAVQMVDTKLLVFPISKVGKFIQDGSDDSFVTMFTIIPYMKNRALKGSDD